MHHLPGTSRTERGGWKDQLALFSVLGHQAWGPRPHLPPADVPTPAPAWRLGVRYPDPGDAAGPVPHAPEAGGRTVPLRPSRPETGLAEGAPGCSPAWASQTREEDRPSRPELAVAPFPGRLLGVSIPKDGSGRAWRSQAKRGGCARGRFQAVFPGSGSERRPSLRETAPARSRCHPASRREHSSKWALGAAAGSHVSVCAEAGLRR